MIKVACMQQYIDLDVEEYKGILLFLLDNLRNNRRNPEVDFSFLYIQSDCKSPSDSKRMYCLDQLCILKEKGTNIGV
jgi:hypothetical protein